MKSMAWIVGALALVACSSEVVQAPEELVQFACYRDGVPTVKVEGTNITMRARLVDGVMVESWVVELAHPTLNGRQHLLHEAGPYEVCGPDPPLAMMD